MPRHTHRPNDTPGVRGAHRIAAESLVLNTYAELTGRRHGGRRRARYAAARLILSARVDAAIAAMSTSHTPGGEVASS